MDSQILEGDCRSQNSLHLSVPNIIKKLLEFKCMKWVCMTHSGTLNISYGQKEHWESKCQFDSRTLKVKNHPNFFVCKWRATYRCKDLNKGYNYFIYLTSIGGFHKLWAFKVATLPILIISGFQLKSLGKKWHLCVSLVAKQKEYYKGEGGGFPQIWIVVSFVSPCLPMAHSCTKSALTTH